MELVIHTDPGCPFCYLFEEVVARLEAGWELEVQWRPFERYPTLPAGGAELTPEGVERMEHLWRPALWLAAALKLPLNPSPVLSNTRRALGVALAVTGVDRGAGASLRRALGRAAMVEGQNLSDLSVVAAVARDALGAHPESLAAALRELELGVEASRVEALTEAARQEGIGGVPVMRPFVEGQERAALRIVGAQHEEVFERVFEVLEASRLQVEGEA